MEEMTILSLVLDFLDSLLHCRIRGLFRKFLGCCSAVIQILSTNVVEDRDLKILHREQCTKMDAEVEILSSEDIRVVIERLGMISLRNKECDKCGGLEGAVQLLDEKEASIEELEEAFYVFDRNEDGFITPVELWSVMRRLEFKEGASLEDCKRMIATFDVDGDGRISFSEFKSMLENAN